MRYVREIHIVVANTHDFASTVVWTAFTAGAPGLFRGRDR